VKYAWIQQDRDSFLISLLCQVLQVSTSGYYDALDRPPSPRAERHARIVQAVQQLHATSHGIYGSRTRESSLDFTASLPSEF
jgi:putative transposase